MNDSEVILARAIAREYLSTENFAKAAMLADPARKDYGAREQSLAYMALVLNNQIEPNPDRMIERGVSSETVRSALLLAPEYLQDFADHIRVISESKDIPALRVKSLELLWDISRAKNGSDRKEMFRLAHMILTRALAEAARGG